MQLRVLVVGSHTASRRELRQHLEDSVQVTIVGEARDATEAIAAAKRGADVAIVEVSEGAGETQALDCIGQLLRLTPGISVMASSGPDGSADLMIRALRAGAVEFLRRPISPDDLAAAIEKVRRLRRVSPASDGKVGQLTALYSTKGGLGVTLLATNLAVCLAQRAPDNVVLLDLDLRQGGVTTLLNLEATYCVLDAFEQTHRLDEAFLRGLVVRHPCGLNILAAPSEIVRTRISPEQMREGLEVIRTHFQHTILDLPHDLDPGTITALEDSDKILYLISLNVPAVRAAAAGLAAFRNLGIDRRKVKVVVSRADSQEEVSLKQARETLGMPILWQTPNDYPTVVSSINQGIPLVLSAPRSEVARNLRTLSEILEDGSDGMAGLSEDNARSSSSLRRVWTSLRSKFSGDAEEEAPESQRGQTLSPAAPVVHRRMQHLAQVQGGKGADDDIHHPALREESALARGGSPLEFAVPQVPDDVKSFVPDDMASLMETEEGTHIGETSDGSFPRGRALGPGAPEDMEQGLGVAPAAEVAGPRRPPGRPWALEQSGRPENGHGEESPRGDPRAGTVHQRQEAPRGERPRPGPHPSRPGPGIASRAVPRSGPAAVVRGETARRGPSR